MSRHSLLPQHLTRVCFCSIVLKISWRKYFLESKELFSMTILFLRGNLMGRFHQSYGVTQCSQRNDSYKWRSSVFLFFFFLQFRNHGQFNFVYFHLQGLDTTITTETRLNLIECILKQYICSSFGKLFHVVTIYEICSCFLNKKKIRLWTRKTLLAEGIKVDLWSYTF